MNNRFFFGFTCLTDLITTFFGKAVVIKQVLSVLVVALLSSAGWICGDANLILMLLSLMVGDWATGVIKAAKTKSLNSYKFMRMAFNIFARFTMIAFAYRISALYPALSFVHLHDILIIYFYLTEFISICENLYAIDPRIVPAKLMKYLQTAADADNIVTSYLQKFKTPDAPIPTPAPTPSDEHDARCAAADDAADPELPQH